MNKLLNRVTSFFQLFLGQKKVYSFGENSVEEAKFFARWYSRDGELKIFCTDLDWLANDSHSEVVEILKGKGNKLHLYLKEYESNLVNQLVNSGANLHKVRNDIRSAHRFSITGANQIIIRNKAKETTPIVVEEYSNNHTLVNLALDMLDDCEISLTRKRR